MRNNLAQETIAKYVFLNEIAVQIESVEEIIDLFSLCKWDGLEFVLSCVQYPCFVMIRDKAARQPLRNICTGEDANGKWTSIPNGDYVVVVINSDNFNHEDHQIFSLAALADIASIENKNKILMRQITGATVRVEADTANVIKHFATKHDVLQRNQRVLTLLNSFLEDCTRFTTKVEGKEIFLADILGVKERQFWGFEGNVYIIDQNEIQVILFTDCIGKEIIPKAITFDKYFKSPQAQLAYITRCRAQIKKLNKKNIRKYVRETTPRGV